MQDKRFTTFMVLALLVFTVYSIGMRWLMPPPPKPAEKKPAAVAKADGKVNGKADGKADVEKPDAEQAAARADADKAAEVAAKPAAKKVPTTWVTLGSADPTSPYRSLVTLTNRGAGVESIELNGAKYRDLKNLRDRSGYLGRLQLEAVEGTPGARVRMVGTGTPAAAAGVKVGDVLTGVGDTGVKLPLEALTALRDYEPGKTVVLKVLRDSKPMTLTATMGHRPLAVLSQEEGDQISYLMTLEQFDDEMLEEGQLELPGVNLRSGNWTVVKHDQDQVVFQMVLEKQQLEVNKTFKIASVPAESLADPDYAGHHLSMEISFRNLDAKAAHRVAYRLDGPTGLPTEGYWYSNKISPNYTGGAGVRDVIMGLKRDGVVDYALYSCNSIVEKSPIVVSGQPVAYVGVDAHYFTAAMIPAGETGDTLERMWFETAQAVRIGEIPAEKFDHRLTNVTCRLISKSVELAADGGVLERDFTLVAAPKRPDLMANYGLDQVVYYGWPIFAFVASIMTKILHGFYSVIPNYGVAILLLTVLVRSCMLPLSIKQAKSAAKMQELKPEMDRITAKFKGDREGALKAQQELWRKHNYNPMAGCLPMLIQLPIFLGLYRCLSVDIELRQASLFGNLVGPFSNLAAPDMLFYWKPYLWSFIADESAGWLGPYFNLLPCFTIALFLWQQKMFMPPATDEQTAMQQKIMKYMMIFFAVMFFKVASGLCLYFIASSLWGITERKLLPKPPVKTEADGSTTPPVKTITVNSNGANAAKDRKKNRGKR